MAPITRAALTGRATGGAVRGGRSASGRTTVAWRPLITGSADAPAVAAPVFITGAAVPVSLADVRTWGTFAHDAAIAARSLIRSHTVVHTFGASDGGPMCDVCGEERSDAGHNRANAGDPARYLRVTQARKMRERVAAATVAVSRAL